MGITPSPLLCFLAVAYATSPIRFYDAETSSWYEEATLQITGRMLTEDPGTCSDTKCYSNSFVSPGILLPLDFLLSFKYNSRSKFESTKRLSLC